MIWEFFMSGGITMIPLMLCSVISLAIVFYKLFDMRTSKFIDQREVGLIKQMIEKMTIKEPNITAQKTLEFSPTLSLGPWKQENMEKLLSEKLLKRLAVMKFPRLKNSLAP